MIKLALSESITLKSPRFIVENSQVWHKAPRMKIRIRWLTVAALLLLTRLTLATEAKPNVLLLCVDDLRPELACYGVAYIQSPNIDRLA